MTKDTHIQHTLALSSYTQLSIAKLEVVENNQHMEVEIYMFKLKGSCTCNNNMPFGIYP